MQAATLAGLVKNPVGFDPTTYQDGAMARRNVVLNRMAELGKITESQAARVEQKGLSASRSAAPATAAWAPRRRSSATTSAATCWPTRLSARPSPSARR